MTVQKDPLSFADKVFGLIIGGVFTAIGAVLLYAIAPILFLFIAVAWFWTGKAPDLSLSGLGLVAPHTPVWGINQILRACYDVPIAFFALVIGWILFKGGRGAIEDCSTRKDSDERNETDQPLNMDAPGNGKKCPYCAETILAAATVCRYCCRDLPPDPDIPRPY